MADHDANAAVTLIRAFNDRIGFGHSVIAFDPRTDTWTLRWGIRVTGDAYSYRLLISAMELAQLRHPDVEGRILAEKLRRELEKKMQTLTNAFEEYGQSRKAASAAKE